MLTTAILAVLVPAAVAAGVAGLGRWFGGRGEPDKAGPWWAASAVGLGYLAGHVAVARPAVPPADVTDRLPWLALAATVVAVFEAAAHAGPVVRAVGRSILAVLTIVLILGPVVAAGDLSREVVVWLAASGAAALAAWVDVEALAAFEGGTDVVRSLTLTAAGAGIALLLSRSAVLAFLGIALTSALTAGRLAGWGKPLAGFVPVAAAVLAGLLLEGFVYASLPARSALLLAAAPAATWPLRLGPLRRLGPWAAAAVGTVAVLVPVGLAVGLAIPEASADGY